MDQVRAKLQANFDPGKDLGFFWCENKAKVVPADGVITSGNLDKTSVKETSRGLYLPVG